MKIIQIVSSLYYGDAVGNNVVAIKRLLQSMAIETEIYTENIGPKIPEGMAQNISRIPKLNNEDIIIYHAATATKLTYEIAKMQGRKIMIYHNITPPHFFHGYSPEAERSCAEALEQTRFLADKLDYCIAVSEFNKKDLISMGFTCPIDVCPIFIEFSDYSKKPNEQVLHTYSDDGYTNVLFVGRIAPNKKHENVIRAFYFYKKYFNEKSRLFLVGSGDGPYLDRLKDYTSLLALEENVIFTGHIKFEEILSYYRIADVFVCMSEHEGFCVPLVEAMYFDVPVIALDSCAVPYTMGDSGILLSSNKPIPAAEAIDRVVSNPELRNEIIEKQRLRLKSFDQESVAKELMELLLNFSDREETI